jgi:NACalpha-BTF3-like transcription factor
VSSRTARARQRNPVSKNKERKKRREEKRREEKRREKKHKSNDNTLVICQFKFNKLNLIKALDSYLITAK